MSDFPASHTSLIRSCICCRRMINALQLTIRNAFFGEATCNQTNLSIARTFRIRDFLRKVECTCAWCLCVNFSLNTSAGCELSGISIYSARGEHRHMVCRVMRFGNSEFNEDRGSLVVENRVFICFAHLFLRK